MNQLTKYSLKNRALIALVTIVSAVFGWFALTGLNQELAPSISYPQVVVVTNYPGAGPEIVNSDVSAPIETALRGIAGLEGTTSTSSSGNSIVSASFEYGIDLATAEQKVQQAVNRIRSVLPAGLDPIALTGSLDDLPILQLAVSASDRDELAVRIENNVLPALERLEGVRQASLSGVPGQRITITPDTEQLLIHGIDQSALAQSLRNYGLLIAAGTVASGDNTVYIQAGSRLESAEAIAGLPVSSALGVIELGDVAEVVLEHDPVTSISRVNGEPAVTISVTKAPDANTVAVSRLVKENLETFSASLGIPATFTVVFDQAPFIEESIETLATEGLLGLFFAIAVILIFLFSIRSTIVTAISIPTSLLVTLIAMQFADYTLNILTLGALTVAIGRVVDDSIVVIENIKRHLVVGAEKVPTILRAVREVAGAITSSTITTVAVFLPIALVGGISGELFRPFAVTVSIALLASLLVSITIVPVLAYWFLKPSNEPAPEEREDAGKETLLQRLYAPILRASLKMPALTVLLAVLVMGGTVALIPSMKTNFIGDSGQNTITVSHSTSAGSSLEYQSELAGEAETIMLGIDGVETVQSTVGGSGLMTAFMGGGRSGIQYSLTTDGEGDQVALQEKLREALTARFGDDISITASGGFGPSTNIAISVTGPDQESLSTATDRLVSEITKLNGVVEVSSNLGASQPLIEVRVDRVEAARLGLTETMVGQLLSSRIQPALIGAIESEFNRIQVYLDTENKPETLADLLELELLQTPMGPILLTDIAEVEEIQAPASVTSIDANRSVSITVIPDANDLGTVTTELNELLAEITLPAGVIASIGGVAADQTEAFEQLGLAVLAAILIVYIIMVATFRSLRQPLLLLVSVPFAATGAIGLLLITDTPLGVPSLIGVLMLVGIVVTNAIVMIDLVNQYRERGKSVHNSLMLGASYRLRPILMTALATIFALLPMALGITGHGGFISQPLALVVIGGLFSSTLLTLVVLPSLYWWVEGFKERRENKRAGIPRHARRNAEVSSKPSGSA